jgi:hypothetical protein
MLNVLWRLILSCGVGMICGCSNVLQYTLFSMNDAHLRTSYFNENLLKGGCFIFLGGAFVSGLTILNVLFSVFL